MNNLQNYQSFNEGIKDKMKREWDKFKDGLHPWDFTLDQWNAKWGDKPKQVVRNYINNEEDWDDLPRNPYTVAEFNAMIRNGEIKRCKEEEADFVWVYKNKNIVFFKKIV